MAQARSTRIAEVTREAAVPSIQSMTGFARAEGGDADFRWAWEAKSVNSRSLDLRIRTPPGYDGLEPRARALAAKRFSRGSLSLHLALRQAERTPDIRVNETVLERLAAVHRSLQRRFDAPPVRLEALMALPGVLERVEAEDSGSVREGRIRAMAETLDAALAALASARSEEGGRLRAVLGRHLDEIEALVTRAAEAAARQPALVGGRIRERVAALLGESAPVAEDRLAQEIALLAARSDVAEEIDRLAGHVAAARDLADAGGVVGRRLDFLCQEFNREANTLCSKSADLGLTRIGLDLKAAVEGLREQVQNVE